MMDLRREVDDEQFLMDMIASGSGAATHVEEADADEQAGDGSNTDVYLHMSGEGDATDQEANVYIIIVILLFKSYLQYVMTITKYMYFFSPLDQRRSLKE